MRRKDREDLVYTQTRNLPAWAHGEAQTYFRAAEVYERANGNAFEEWQISLPQELRPRQNMDCMRDLVAIIAGDRLPITYAFHCPQTLDGTQPQPHLHLLLSGRQNDGLVRTPAQYFKRYNRVHPERGGAQKDPALSHFRAVKGWRVTMSDIINVHLEHAGLDERLHPDRLEDRALDRQPEPKLLPSESRDYRENGAVSATIAAVLTLRAVRQQTRAVEQANARAYWGARKVALGLTEGMDLPAQLAVIGTARALGRDQAPTRTVAQSDAGVEQGARALREVGVEAVQEARAAGHEALEAAWQERWQRVAQAQAWPNLAQAMEALARQLDDLSGAEGGHGHRRIRLWEREREPELGL
jgi:hypothetical protein